MCKKTSKKSKKGVDIKVPLSSIMTVEQKQGVFGNENQDFI